MLFPEEDADLLKAWIVKRLEKNPNADADADVLADYVLALLRHEGGPDTIREHFQTELHDFLREDTAAFTDDVFQAVQFRSYVPGAPPAPPAPPTARLPRVPPPAAIAPTSTSLYHPSAPFSEPLTPATFPQAGSRKRAYNDRDDGDVDIILNSQPLHGPPQKLPRRGGGFGQRGGRNHNSYLPNSFRGVPQFPELPGSLPYGDVPLIDANSILQNMQFLQSLLPPGADLPPLPTSSRRKKRCRDYEKKGYCSRGTHCNFDHETEQPFMLPPMPMAVDEYDPKNAVLSLPPVGIQTPQVGQQLDPSSFSPFPPPNRREPKKSRRMKGRPAFAANGRNNDKSKTTIVVQNIPSENFSEDHIRDYFSQFGSIVELQLQNQNSLAIIKFDSWEAANAAWSSPKVIFDNRFVKVFWYKDETSDKITPNENRANSVANGHVDGATSASKSVPAEAGFDLEEFHRKQVEAQKIHDEKTKKRQEIELERQRLEERQKLLSEQRARATRILQAKLRSNGFYKDEPHSPAGVSAENGGKDSSAQTEALRAQLAALEQEANQLGINPDENHDDALSWTLRGRGRGRGFRGRGTFVPRAIRGGYGYRGRGGIVESRHAAYAAYSLDNRPKVVALSGVDFTLPENDEALRQYLFSVGEFKEVHGVPAVTHVTFKDRKTAEKFMFGVSANNTIHGVDGKIEPTWAKTAPETTKMGDSDIATAGSVDDEQNNEKKADIQVEDANVDREDGEIESALDHDQGDMDYEAGEW
ncbi:hypothetical protein F5Y08DRAFT_100751 [Xylaria arbuscula]|nr:hypothetical protein F5Y08DRAFT_100751 [Xylaria arbuscula]